MRAWGFGVVEAALPASGAAAQLRRRRVRERRSVPSRDDAAGRRKQRPRRRLVERRVVGRVDNEAPQRDARGDALRSTANLTGMLHLDGEPADPARLQRELKSQHQAAREGDDLVSAAALTWLPLWLMTWVGRRRSAEATSRDRYGSSAVLSNLGRVDVESLRAPDFTAARATLVPPAGHSTPLFALFTGGPLGVEIAVSMPAPLASGGRLEEVLSVMVESQNT